MAKRKYTYKTLVHTPGKLYDSLRDCAAETGLTPQGVSHRCKSNKYKDWFIIELDEPITK